MLDSLLGHELSHSKKGDVRTIKGHFCGDALFFNTENRYMTFSRLLEVNQDRWTS